MTDTRSQPACEPVRARGPACRLCAGDSVRVRSREDILATLDADGRIDGMPFMPEMLAFCGQTLRVAKRAHKTCDTISYTGARRLERTVHLEGVRCDGSAHGGCQAACLLYWNEAWLEPAAPSCAGARPPRAAPAQRRASGCSMEQLAAAARPGLDPDKGPRYACHATDLGKATTRWGSYDPRQYIQDLRSGNIDLATLFHGTVYRVGVFLVRRGERLGRRLGRGDAIAKALMAGYDALQKVLPGGVPYPRRTGLVPKGQPTPDVGIGTLQPGSWVRIKPYAEILQTLDCNNRTRGLYFDAEHVPYCEKAYPVQALVNRIIDERTGYMLHFKSPSIILKDVVCRGSHSDNRMFCPRAIYPFWRPAWLQPVERGRTGSDAPAASPQAAPLPETELR